MRDMRPMTQDMVKDDITWLSRDRLYPLTEEQIHKARLICATFALDYEELFLFLKTLGIDQGAE